MSTTKRVAALSAFLVLLSSCGKPSVPVVPQEESKTSLIITDKLEWKEGCEVSVFNGKDGADNCANSMYRAGALAEGGMPLEFIPEAYPGGPKEADTSEGKFISAAYPFSRDFSYEASTSTISFIIPQESFWSKDGVTLPRFAGSDLGELSFCQKFGALRICLSGTQTIKSLAFSATKPLCGTASVQLGFGEPSVSFKGRSNDVRVSFGEGRQLTETRSTNVDILLPAGSYGNIDITIEREDDTPVRSSIENVTIQDGRVISSQMHIEPTSCDPWGESGMEGKTYICNGKIQVGIDLQRGGCIFNLSDAERKKNVLNHYDNGRFVQQSYYGNVDGSVWNGQAWRYNPVQGGGYKNAYPARVVSTKVEASSLSCTSIPVNWASCVELPECSMTEEITLEGEVAHIHYSFSYNGTISHQERHQELPAVFCNREFGKLYHYNGSKPWTGAALSVETPNDRVVTGKNEYLERNAWAERWGAYINDEGWGVGVYTPSSTMATYYVFGTTPSGSKMSTCSYIAPLGVYALTPGLTKSYDVYMTIGTIEEIRARFTEIHNR